MIENPFDPEIRDAVLNSDTLADLISKDVQDIMRYECAENVLSLPEEGPVQVADFHY